MRSKTPRARPGRTYLVAIKFAEVSKARSRHGKRVALTVGICYLPTTVPAPPL
jgi:hypothetical protein